MYMENKQQLQWPLEAEKLKEGHWLGHDKWRGRLVLAEIGMSTQVTRMGIYYILMI